MRTRDVPEAPQDPTRRFASSQLPLHADALARCKPAAIKRARNRRVPLATRERSRGVQSRVRLMVATGEGWSGCRNSNPEPPAPKQVDGLQPGLPPSTRIGGMRYQIVIKQEPDGQFSASSPDLPGVFATG